MNAVTVGAATAMTQSVALTKTVARRARKKRIMREEFIRVVVAS
jgi:hypothetical protein